ncbi:hypothetical protein LTR66_000207 [Elasticomyces elasticus]|nr:hypothetical protein LTR66_000207 [Elasticomyces elasticus]
MFTTSPPHVTSYSHDALVNILQEAIQALAQYLPTALPLYRRLQYRHFSSQSYLLVSSTSNPSNGIAAEGVLQNARAIAFVDRDQRPETEVWMFGVWEARAEDEVLSEHWMDDAADHVKALLKKIRDIGLPTTDGHSSTVVGARSCAGKNDQYNTYVKYANVVLCGTVHERTKDVMIREGLMAQQDGGIYGRVLGNRKYLFDLRTLGPASRPLPPNLRFAPMRPEYYNLVRSRTPIPRTDRTLSRLPSTAIYPISTVHPHGTPSAPPAPVAWAFLGLDASLTTLHVEPEYRGRGLAKLVTLKLFSDEMDAFGGEEGAVSQGKRWAHADVQEGNVASYRVMESVGARWSWETYWLKVDVDKAG